MWPSLFFVAGSDRHPHNVLHERHSSRLPAGDEAPPFQGVGTSPKCDGTDAHTGTGKTHLLAAIVREFLRGSGSRVWIVAHRRELVDQIEETVSRHGMSKEDGRVRVMSIQWLSRNRKSMDEEPDLIVIDEAHHALAETYRILWENYPEARKLGMTACNS